MSLCHAPAKGQSTVSRENASMIVAKELREDWIQKNIYPMNERSVAKKIKADYELFKVLRKRETEGKCTTAWSDKVQSFNDLMTKRAYDIRAKSRVYEKQLELEYRVSMTQEDIAFYNDNCHGEYVATCTKTVPRYWEKQQKRKFERGFSMENHRLAMEQQVKDDNELHQQQLAEALQTEIPDSDSEEMDPTLVVTPGSPNPTDRVTRSSSQSNTKDSNIYENTFPKVKIRTGRKTLNESLMRCIVQCHSAFKTTTDDLRGIIVSVANTIFGQKWEISDELENFDDEQEDSYEECKDLKLKRRRCSRDLTYIMPSRSCITKYLEDAYFLNLELVAKLLTEKGDSVITVGLADTTKAAGHKLFDVKADHITISGPSCERKSLTTGYTENASHSGADGARAYEQKLKILALLADTTLDDMKAQVDFWMTDRATDCRTVLEKLGAEDNQVLKCCAHLILGIDHAVDKIFQEAERKIGVQNLIKTSAGSKVFMCPGSSIHTLSLIAISKLLSPSHASHSVSLYNEFITWMDAHKVKYDGFKGFISNRFGRIAELAKTYLKLKEHILKFFEAVVDENSNKLVLAVSTYIQNDWFQCCTEVYSLIADWVIFPIMDLLGIDKQQDHRNENRNWVGVREFFKTKLDRLEHLKADFKKTATGKGKLIGAVMEETVETLKRQLNEMDYFDDEVNSEIDQEKLKFAPLTNLGCESEFAKLDNRVKISGGSTSIRTHSMKTIVATNRLLVSSDFLEKTDAEKRQQWKWACTSDAVKKAKQLEKDFLETVKVTKQLSIMKKEELKKKKILRTQHILEMCKAHGGPVTVNSIGILEKLSEKQLINEISYIRITVAPEIRQKRRIRNEEGKIKYQNFSVKELRESIRNFVKPEGEVTKDIDKLLQDAFV